MLGGVLPDHSRLNLVLQTILEQNADIVGCQETKLSEDNNGLLFGMKNIGYNHYELFDRDEK